MAGIPCVVDYLLLLSTHRYLVFVSFTTKALPSEDAHTWSELGCRVYPCVSKQDKAGYS